MSHWRSLHKALKGSTTGHTLTLVILFHSDKKLRIISLSFAHNKRKSTDTDFFRRPENPPGKFQSI